MSTRCNIIVRGFGQSFTLYHHHDGYPEGVGVDLKKRLAGNSFYAAGFANRLIKDPNDEYEIAGGLSSDIEYLYIVYIGSKTQGQPSEVKCYKVDYKDFLPDGRLDIRIICQNKNLVEIPEE